MSIVNLLKLLCSFWVIRVLIGMILQCQFPVALLDVIGRGVLVQPQHMVERIPGRGQGTLPLLRHGQLIVILWLKEMTRSVGRQGWSSGLASKLQVPLLPFAGDVN